MRTRLAREGIAYADLIHLLDDLAYRAFVASRFDPHPSPLVHRRIGRALAAQLRTLVDAAADA